MILIHGVFYIFFLQFFKKIHPILKLFWGLTIQIIRYVFRYMNTYIQHKMVKIYKNKGKRKSILPNPWAKRFSLTQKPKVEFPVFG